MNNYMKTIISGLKQWVSSQKSDWNQNDSSAANFIKNRPFYSEEKEKVLFSSNSLSSQRFTLTQPLVKGNTYTVVFNGTTYQCLAKEYDGYIMIGNNAIYEYDGGIETDTGEPFAIEGMYNRDGFYGYVYYADTVVEAPSISILGTVEEVHQIDKKYVPMPDLADVAHTGDYGDLLNLPTIYPDPVRYSSQDYDSYSKKIARTNIAALGVEQPNKYSGKIVRITSQVFVLLPEIGSTHVYVSRDRCLTWQQVVLDSSVARPWVDATLGSGNNIIILSRDGQMCSCTNYGTFLKTFTLPSAVSSLAPFKAIATIGNWKIVLVPESGNQVAIANSGSYQAFTIRTLPFSAEWGYAIASYNLGSRVMLIPKEGNKTVDIQNNSTYERALPKNGVWLEPKVKHYTQGSIIYLIDEQGTSIYGFGSSAWAETNISSSGINPLVLLSGDIIIPKNGDQEYWYYTSRSVNGYSSYGWDREPGMNFNGVFPTSIDSYSSIGKGEGELILKVNNELYFGTQIKENSKTKIIWYKTVINNGSVQNEHIANGIEPFLRDKGYSESVVVSSIGNNSIIQKNGDNLAIGNYAKATGLSTLAYGNYASSEGKGEIESAKLTGEANATVYNTNLISRFATNNLVIYKDIIAKVVAVDSTAETVTLDRTLSSQAFSDTVRIQKNGYAYGEGSHSEGMQTITKGEAAHSEGAYTIASGYASHAEGSFTIAASGHQHVEGIYNIEDSNSRYAHIVGNGESDFARSNAHTLAWDGNAWFAGNIYVGGTGQDSAAAVKVAIVPFPTEADEGKILRVVNGAPTWVALSSAEEASF